MNDEYENPWLQALLQGTPQDLLASAAKQGGGEALTLEIERMRDALVWWAVREGRAVRAGTNENRLRFLARLEELKPTHQALLVMDMQVDHLSEERPLFVPRAREIVPALARRIEESRAQNIPVIFLCDQHAEGDPEIDDWVLHNLPGSGGDNVWPELGMKPTDLIVHHRAYSGFFQTDLLRVLKHQGIDEVVLTGCLTEVHLYATAMDALMNGFRVQIPRELQAGNHPMAEEMVLSLLSLLRPVRSFEQSK